MNTDKNPMQVLGVTGIAMALGIIMLLVTSSAYARVTPVSSPDTVRTAGAGTIVNNGGTSTLSISVADKSSEDILLQSMEDDESNGNNKYRDRNLMTMSDDGSYLAVASSDPDHVDTVIRIFQWNSATSKYEFMDGIDKYDVKKKIVDMAFDDLDNDGLVELITGSSEGDLYSFEETGDSFEKIWQSDKNIKPKGFEIYDVDNNGSKEIVVTVGEKGISVLGSTTPDFYSSVYERWNSREQSVKAEAVTVGDFNGDQVTDFLVSFDNGTVAMYELTNAQCSDGKKDSDDDYEESSSKDEDKDEDKDDDKGKGKDKDKGPSTSFDLCFKPSWKQWITEKKEDMAFEQSDIDSDGIPEIAINVLGENVFLLNTRGQQFFLDKLTYSTQLWEQSGAYPIDMFADTVLMANNVTFDGIADLPEPMDWFNPLNVISPYTSGMERDFMDHFSSFNSTGASAVIDWGEYEEITGGANSDADLLIHLNSPFTGNLSALRLSLSDEDYEFSDDDHDDDDDYPDVDDEGDDDEDDDDDYESDSESDEDEYLVISSEDMWLSEDNMTIFVNIDTLKDEEHAHNLHDDPMASYRYMKLDVAVGTSLEVLYWEAVRINLPLDNVRSMLFNEIKVSEDGGATKDVLTVSTSSGKLITFQYEDNQMRPSVVQIADSYQDQGFTLKDGGAWAMLSNPNFNARVNTWINPVASSALDSLDLRRIRQVTLGDDVVPFGSNANDDAENNLYIVGRNAEIRVLLDPSMSVDTKLSSDLFAGMTKYYMDLGLKDIRITVFDFMDTTAPEVFVTSNSKSLDIWKYTGTTYEFYNSIAYSTLDPSNNITDAVLNYNAPMEITSGDFDADGMKDIVLSDSQSFFFLKHELVNGSNALTYVPHFFDGAELAARSIGYHEFQKRMISLQGFDYDSDGDADLLSSFYGRPGLTFLENQQEDEFGAWTEKRSYVNNHPVGTTFTNEDIDFGVVWEGKKDGQKVDEPVLFGINHRRQASLYSPSYDGQQGLLIADGYHLKTLTTNFVSSNSYDNWGYQYFEETSLELDFDKHEYDCECRSEFYLLEEIKIRGGDSDGDGIMDGLEGFSRLNGLKTDISNFDTDGDGLSDKFEIENGLNPRSDDTDSDLIPDAFDHLDHDDDHDDDEGDDGHDDDDEDHLFGEFYHNHHRHSDSDDCEVNESSAVIVESSGEEDVDAEDDQSTTSATGSSADPEEVDQTTESSTEVQEELVQDPIREGDKEEVLQPLTVDEVKEEVVETEFVDVLEAIIEVEPEFTLGDISVLPASAPVKSHGVNFWTYILPNLVLVSILKKKRSY